MTDNAQNASGASPRIGLIRLAIGLLQGLAIYGLYRSVQDAHTWPATQPTLFAILAFLAALAPPIKLAGWGAMRLRTLVIWGIVAVVVIAGLVAYDCWRDAEPNVFLPPSLALVGVALAAFLFIAHHLIEPADIERRPIASYAAYFDNAWKHAVQLGLSAAFVGAFWAVFALGAALFGMVGLKFLTTLLTKAWFNMPLTGAMFAMAVHLTDVRAGLTRGFRTVGLILLSWLMPLMAVLTAGFLVALIFTGLKPIWQYIGSSGMLLGAAATLIILINATYQDGQADTQAPFVLRWAARGAALLVTPLLVLAGIGIFLRIGQHGLTADRIVSLACLVIGVCYALGYAIAAVRPGPWMKPLERTNVVTACVILAVILALFTPVADPARIAVGDQVSRLEHGKIAPDKFDYEFLRYKSGRYGRDALARLAVKTSGPHAAAIAARAKATLAEEFEVYRGFAPAATPSSSPIELSTVPVYPKGQKLPDSFVAQHQGDPSVCRSNRESCSEAFLIDLDGDGKSEVILQEYGMLEVFKEESGAWTNEGHLVGCPGFAEALKTGKYELTTPVWRDVVVGSAHYHMMLNGRACPN